MAKPTQPQSAIANQDQKVPHGIWGAVMLPINPAAQIDWPALEAAINILCASSVSGIYTNGTAAEFHNQTESEFDRISDITATRAKAAGKPFQIGVSNTNPRVARERLARIRGLGPTGVQITLPDWWPPSQPEIERFVAGMAETAGDVPLILYNPPHAKVKLTLEQLAALRAQVPTLVGTKVAGGDADWYRELREMLPGFSVFVAGHTIATGRRLGADGSYSNVACLSPNGAVHHWHLIDKDPEAALDLERRIQAFIGAHIMPLVQTLGLSNTALDKLLAAIGGWGPIGARLLWPYSYADDGIVTALHGQVRADLPELFQD